MGEEYILTEREAIEDVMSLTVLEMSIYSCGIIKHDENPDFPYPAPEESARVSKLDILMGKYTYGWYIAESKKMKEQVKEINAFKDYILCNVGKRVCHNIT